MPFYTAGKAKMLDGPGLAPAITHLSMHTSAGVPSSAGSNEATGGSPAYTRKVPTFSMSSGGVLTLASAVTFDLPAGTYRYVGGWAGTTFLCYGLMLNSSGVAADRVLTGQDVVTINQFSPTVSTS